MLSVKKLNKASIESETASDIEKKDDTSIEKLKEFHYKIVIEDGLRTSSFRYYYAKTALEFICNKLGDKETITNLGMYHRSKVQFELANPVENKAPIKRNPATREQLRGTPKVDRSTPQINL